MKDFTEVTLSTFFTQKDHSGCTVEARLEEVEAESPLGLCWVSLNLSVAAVGLEHT